MSSSHFQRLANTTFFKNTSKNIDYAIFSAMPEELDYIKHKFKTFPNENVRLGEFVFTIYNYKNVKVLLISCGIGTTFIASALTLVYYHFQPKYVLFSGVAGGVDPSLRMGDVVIAEKAFEAEVQALYLAVRNTPFESCLIHPFNKITTPNLYSCDETLLSIAKNISFTANLIVRYGNVVSSNKFPAPVELYQEIREQQALSIDMETSAFYQIAWLLNIPALAIRGISNCINSDGTDENIHLSDLVGSAETAAKVSISILDALILKLNMSSHGNAIDDETNEIINRFQLQAHPEGGYYARNFTSELSVTSFDSKRYDGESRKAGSSIYYLLRENEFSAFHILKSDEIWHYYKGSPVKIHIIDISGKLTTCILGNSLEYSEAMFQVIIPANNWFAAEVMDKTSFSFVGCTVSPGFEFKDFKMADRDSLSAEFPNHSAMIKSFTRNIVDKNESDVNNIRIKSKL